MAQAQILKPVKLWPRVSIIGELWLESHEIETEFNRAVQWPPVSLLSSAQCNSRERKRERERETDERGQIPQENLRNLSLIHVNKFGSRARRGRWTRKLKLMCEHRGLLLSTAVGKDWRTTCMHIQVHFKLLAIYIRFILLYCVAIKWGPWLIRLHHFDRIEKSHGGCKNI